MWGSGDEDEKLASAVRSALELARDHGLKSVSLPAISSGIFGFPKPRCARVMLQTVLGFTGLSEIRLCNVDEPTAEIFAEELERSRSNTRTNYEPPRDPNP